MTRAAQVPRPGAKLVSIQGAALDLGVPSSSLRDLIGRGVLPTVRLPGTRRIWIKRADLDLLLERSVEVTR